MPKFKVGDHVIINKNVSGTIVFINDDSTYRISFKEPIRYPFYEMTSANYFESQIELDLAAIRDQKLKHLIQ